LIEVIKWYPGIKFHEGTSILNGQLRCIFHFRNELEAYKKKLEGEIPKLHLHLMLQFMKRELRREIKGYNANVETTNSIPSVEFQDLWTVFRPGEPIITGRDEREQLMLLDSMELVEGNCTYWNVSGMYLTHDGTQYGYAKKTIRINPFEGAREIKKLDIYPLKYHAKEESLKLKHTARGQKFCSLTGVHHRSYKGIATALGHELDKDQYGWVDKYPSETKMVNSPKANIMNN
jgi:hypothetical protein